MKKLSSTHFKIALGICVAVLAGFVAINYDKAYDFISSNDAKALGYSTNADLLDNAKKEVEKAEANVDKAKKEEKQAEKELVEAKQDKKAAQAKVKTANK